MGFEGKKVLVLGLGDTGLSMASWLIKQGAQVCVSDSRDAPPRLEEFVAQLGHAARYLGPFRERDFLDADVIAVSPGVSIKEPLVANASERGVPVIGDVELFAQSIKSNDKVKVLAITGSNGKSTVTTLAGDMCRAAGTYTVVAGNIGLPVLDALSGQDQIGNRVMAYVLELSSFQLETTYSLNATASTVLNVSQDHLDRYTNMAEYAHAKARVFHGRGIQVLNRDDGESAAMARPGRKIFSFGLSVPETEQEWGTVTFGGERWLANGGDRLMPISELQVTGLHNAVNTLASLALCRALGLAYEPLLQAARNFKGLPHRVDMVAEISGVGFYDDSKGTNVGATVAALNGMSRPVVLIAGGDGKGQDFTPLKPALSGHGRAVILIGRDGGKIGAAIEGCGLPVSYSDTLEDAVKAGFMQSLPGDAVLLSPACASFDMFKNYQHRAQVFIDAVLRLKADARVQ